MKSLLILFLVGAHVSSLPVRTSAELVKPDVPAALSGFSKKAEMAEDKRDDSAVRKESASANPETAKPARKPLRERAPHWLS